MKKIKSKLLFLSMQLLAFGIFAQSPSLINYQGVARDGNGNVLKNKTIGLKFEFRQGSAGAPVIFSEAQTATTSGIGLFITQVGKVNTAGISSINWQGGSMFMEVSIDTAGGTNYIGLGIQQLVSSPYAMHAQSVPSTYSNNILTIGSGVSAAVYTLSSTGGSPNTTLTATGGGATVTSSGTNTFNVDVPATTFSSGTNVNIQGSHPNYTISSVPTLSLSGNNLSISGGNTITIPTATASIVSTGAATTSVLAPNSFSIQVPIPTFTNTGQNIITGTYPNFTVNTPTVTAGVTPTITGLGVAAVTPITGTNFTVTVPNPSIAVAGTLLTLTQGTSVSTAVLNTYTTGAGLSISGGPNYTISSSATSPTIIGAGAAVVSPITGTNFTVTVPPLAVAVTASASTMSVTSVGSNSVSINIPTVSVSGSGVTGSYPNYIISASSTPTINGSGAAVVSPTTGSNFTVTVPPLDVAVTSSASTMSVTSVGSNSVSINIPTVSVSGAGVTGSYPNYVIAAASTPTINGAGIAVVSPTTGNNFIVSVPPLDVAITSTSNVSSVTSTGDNSVSINIPTVSVSGSGVTGSYPNYVVPATPPLGVVITATSNVSGVTSTGSNSVSINIPTVSVSGSGVTGSYPNYIVTAPSTPTINGGGIAVVSPTTGNNFTVTVPAPTLGVSGGSVSITGGNSVLLPSPTIALTQTSAVNPAITSIGSSYTINIPQPTLSIASGSIAISGGNSVSLPTASMVLTATAASGPSLTTSAGSFSLNIPPSAGWLTGGNAGTTPATNYLGTSDAQPLVIRTNNTPRIMLDVNGQMGLGTATPGINTGAARYLTVSSTTAYANSMAAIELEGGSLSTFVPVGRIDFNSAIGSVPSSNIVRMAALRAGNATAGVLAFSTSDAVSLNERMRISEIGNVGLGTTITNSAKLNILAATTDTSSPYGISITNNYTGASTKSGIDINVDGAGSSSKYGVNATITGLAGDGNGNYAFNAAMTPNGSGTTYGNNTTINAAGSGIRYGLFTSVSALAANNSNIYGHRIALAGTNATALKYGLYVAGEDMNYFSNSVGIGTATPIYKLVLAGPQANGIDGPNLSFVTSQDNYPTMHMFNWNHAEQYIMFNAYYDGAFRSSTTTGNFKMGSYNGKMIFQAAGGYAAGTNMNANFNDAMMIGNNGFVGIGLNSATTQPTYRFHVENDDAGVMAYFNNPSQSSGTALRTEVVTTATSTGTRYGHYSQAANGQSVNYGTYSHAHGGQQSFGIWTESGGQSTVWNMGLYSAATGTNGVYAAYMIGNVWVGGTLSKSAGTFKIDHPQDPENKYLIHSFVESPDMMNVYNGNTVTDANGDAIVQLPGYFEAENINFRYQLTAIGQFAQAIVLEEVSNNQFKIKTDKPNVKVSWQVTGVRNDAYAKKNRVVPEVDKEENNRGKYLAPEAYGLDESMRIGPKREDLQDNHNK